MPRAAQNRDEVVNMTCDGFWELFIDTGDPRFWLMSHRESAETAQNRKPVSAGDAKRAPAEGRPQAVL